ncbi:MAG TPA: glycosyltransferase family 39 protein [Allocoleopsis sp.]
MLVSLPLLSFLITSLIFFHFDREQEKSLRDSFIKASITYGVSIVALTEILSTNHILETKSITIFWGVILVINAIIALAINQQILMRSLYLKVKFWRPVNFDNLISAFAVLMVLSITLATALIAAPNNWDAMAYHLPRVMHWLQNQTVAHYSTNNLRQISLSPGAGYLVAQLQILAGSDCFANCIQWLAFLGSTLAISLVTEKLSRGTEWFSMLLCISMPMAIMQATTPQTDLLLTYWLLCLTYFIFKSNTYQVIDYFFISASLGLSFLSKPTAFLFSFPLIVIFIFRSLAESKSLPKKIIVNKIILIFLTLAGSLSLSIGIFWRNYLLFNSLLGPGFGTRNEILGAPQLFSNLLKNLALNLPIPGFWQFINFIHQYLLQVDINDPRLNYVATPLAQGSSSIHLAIPKVLAPHEDYVGNPIHLLLIVLGWVTLACSYKRYHRSPKLLNLLAISIASLIGFLSFCLLLKWQVWGNRLLLPLFALNIPLMTHYLHVAPPRLRRSLITLLAILAILYALTPMRHPFIALPTGSDEQSASILSLPRSQVYFSGVRKELATPYQAAIAAVQPCRSVGLALGGDDWEYPLWVLMRQQSPSPFQMKHVNVMNESQATPPEFPDEQICAVVSTIPTYQPSWSMEQEVVWQKQTLSQAPFVAVFIREARQAS